MPWTLNTGPRPRRTNSTQTHGGNATAFALSINPKGPAFANAKASGGDGHIPGTAYAEATAKGLSGGVTSTSDPLGTRIHHLVASAGISSSPALATSTSSARVAQSAPTTTTDDVHVFTFATGLPLPADVSAALSGNPAAQIAFPAPEDVFGLMLMGGRIPAGDVEGGLAVSGSAQFEVDSTLTNELELRIGLLNPLQVGSSFDELRFRVLREDEAIVDMIFDSPASALAFFDDNVLGFAPIVSGPSLRLDFHFDLTGTTPGSGFEILFVAGAVVPEPVTILPLLCLGSMLLARQRRPAR